MRERDEHGAADEEWPARAALGTGALLFAAAVPCLSVVQWAAGTDLPMPSSWHHHRTLWWILAFAAGTMGWMLLRSRSPVRESWRPEKPGRRFARLRLYTREGCHLCDHARDSLWKHGAWLPTIEEVDIDREPELVRRFDTCVPVVEFDGKVRFRGRVDESLLRRLIQGTPPREKDG